MNRSSFNPNKIIAPASPLVDNVLGGTSPAIDTFRGSASPPLGNDLGGTSPGIDTFRGSTSPPLEGCPKGGVAHRVHKSQRVKSWSISINNIPIIRNFVENLPYNPSLSKLARDKRKAGILSEVLFWQQVHKRLFHEIDFDRQRIIGNYIVDFYVKTLGLIVEIDGRSHDNKQEYDAKRQRYLEDLGLRVYRITDFDVKNNLDIVMGDLESYIVREYGRED